MAFGDSCGAWCSWSTKGEDRQEAGLQEVIRGQRAQGLVCQVRDSSFKTRGALHCFVLSKGMRVSRGLDMHVCVCVCVCACVCTSTDSAKLEARGFLAAVSVTGRSDRHLHTRGLSQRQKQRPVHLC